MILNIIKIIVYFKVWDASKPKLKRRICTITVFLVFDTLTQRDLLDHS